MSIKSKMRMPNKNAKRKLMAWNIKKVLGVFNRNFIWVLLIILMVATTLVNRAFLTPANIINILIAAAALGCLVIGESSVLIVAQIDLSIEGNMIFSALVGAVIMMPPSSSAYEGVVKGGLGMAWPIALVVMLAVSALIGLLNGLMIAKLRMNPFMVTLAVLLVLTGLSLAVGQGRQFTNLPAGFRFVGGANLGPIPISVIFLIVLYVITYMVLSRTIFGRRLYAVGSNRAAARAAGINDENILITAYVISGFMAGLAAFLLVGRLGTASASISSGTLFLAIAAAVVGGVSLFGGRGTATGMFGGLLLMGTITNAMNLADMPGYYVNTVSGLIILVAVLLDALRSRRSLAF